MAKTLLLVLSFLLLNSFFCVTAQEPSRVRDTAGNELREGVGYYILPYIFALGGGVTLGKPVNTSETCPNTVVQDPFEVNNGLSVTFTPAIPNAGAIPVSSDLNIRFYVVPTDACPGTNVWRIEYAEEIGQYVILNNGAVGNPGPATLDSWFKIEEYNGDYRLTFCPSVCDICRPICMGVGISYDQAGIRRLILTDEEPYRVVFRKA